METELHEVVTLLEHIKMIGGWASVIIGSLITAVAMLVWKHIQGIKADGFQRDEMVQERYNERMDSLTDTIKTGFASLAMREDRQDQTLANHSERITKLESQK